MILQPWEWVVGGKEKGQEGKEQGRREEGEMVGGKERGWQKGENMRGKMDKGKE